MKTELKYTTEAEYEEAMVEIDEMMKKGDDALSKEELHKLETMALAAQAFEMQHYYEEPPRTLEGFLEVRMYEMKMEGGNLAETLGFSEGELLGIINRERAPSVDFLKAVHTKLDVPADFILQHV